MPPPQPKKNTPPFRYVFETVTLPRMWMYFDLSRATRLLSVSIRKTIYESLENHISKQTQINVMYYRGIGVFSIFCNLARNIRGLWWFIM